MEMPKFLLCAQVGIHIVLFIMSLFVCIPAGVSITRFNGHCLLYAKGYWNIEPSGSDLSHVDWGPDSACNFTVFISVVSLIFALFHAIWISTLLARGLERSRLDIFVNLVLNIIMCVCFFSTALTVSIGFREWCKLVTDPKSGIGRCMEGQNIPFGSSIDVNTQDFYTHWQIAQFGVWFCWIIWLVLVIWSLIVMYNHYRREAFMISVNNERQRLISQVSRGYEPL